MLQDGDLIPPNSVPSGSAMTATISSTFLATAAVDAREDDLVVPVEDEDRVQHQVDQLGVERFQIDRGMDGVPVYYLADTPVMQGKERDTFCLTGTSAGPCRDQSGLRKTLLDAAAHGS